MLKQLIVGLSISGLSIGAMGCNQEAPTQPAAPLTAPPAAAPMQAPATAPVAPPPATAAAQPTATVVFASADPQHGGQTQKVGDYMVELATGDSGKVDFYVNKYEGAVPSFDNVQLEVLVKDKAKPDEKGKEAIFYPENGKLQGTVAGMEKGKYDFGVTLFEKDTNKSSSGTFADVDVTPAETDLTAKHDGTVHLIDETKMEMVRENEKLKVYLRDKDDNPIDPSKASISETVVATQEGTKELVELTPEGDHFEGDIAGDIDKDALKLISGVLNVEGKEYKDLRIPTIPSKDGKTVKPLKLTKSKAEKGTKEAKGAVGTIALDPGKVTKKNTSETSSLPKKKKKKGPITKAKTN